MAPVLFVSVTASLVPVLSVIAPLKVTVPPVLSLHQQAHAGIGDRAAKGNVAPRGQIFDVDGVIGIGCRAWR